MVLGGGSNVVLPPKLNALVVKVALSGIDVEESGDDVLLTVSAGENWHGLVEFCLQHGYYGIENLALIPGTVGAAPIQNIGAYGVELESCFHALRGWDIQQQQWRRIDKADCQFGYRDSVFKHQLKDRFIITEVTLRLSRYAQFHTEYPALKQALSECAASELTPRAVADAVIAVRQSKLPDPGQLPNAGSFFKNPVVDVAKACQLKNDFPAMVQYPVDGGYVKLAAGWLIDSCGWKGKSQGAIAVHQQQALVLVNRDGAQQGDVLALAEAIQADVRQRYGVELEIEPRVYR